MAQTAPQTTTSDNKTHHMEQTRTEPRPLHRIRMPTTMDKIYDDIFEKEEKLTNASMKMLIDCRYGVTATDGRCNKFARLAWQTLYNGDRDDRSVLRHHVDTAEDDDAKSSRWDK